MKISKINQEADKIATKQEQKQAILTLIDEKIEHDMEKVLAKIDSRFDSINNKFDSKLDSVNSKIDWLKWLIGSIGFAIVIAAIKYVFFS